MMKLLIDSNIAIDLLAQREEFYEESSILFSSSDQKKLNLCLSSLSFANMHYILSRHSTAVQLREVLRKFKNLITILELNEKIIDLALNDMAFSDFEDGLQYYTAVENQIDIIITRDKKGFRNSHIPVMTAKEYLNR